jgi:hypothetical protein
MSGAADQLLDRLRAAASGDRVLVLLVDHYRVSVSWFGSGVNVSLELPSALPNDPDNPRALRWLLEAAALSQTRFEAGLSWDREEEVMLLSRWIEAPDGPTVVAQAIESIVAQADVSMSWVQGRLYRERQLAGRSRLVRV